MVAPQLDALRAPGLVAGLQRWRPAQDDRASRLARGQTNVYRRIWEQAAVAVGADLKELDAGFLTLSRNGVQTVVWRHLVMLDHPATLALSLDKSVVHRLLTDEGLPVPEHVEAGREDRASALAFVASSAEPCVVKPAKGTSDGDGVTCGVEQVEDVWRAWLAAARWDSRILVERQAPGEEYRLLLLDGELLGVVHRRRPSVLGNGTATVLELIEAENERRLDANQGDVSRAISVDLDCELAVRRSRLTLRSVPRAGQVVTVKSTVGQNAMAENSTVHDVSPELVRECARAAALLQLRLAGVDLVTPDCTASLTEAGGMILEVNATPGLHYHYQTADPEQASRVAEPILRALLSSDAG
jgi:cyanophycin synthetase